jgi:RNase P subunit RPR2
MEQGVVCKKCYCRTLELIKTINPDTVDMNMDVILKCNKCGHEDTYQISSNRHEEQKNMGFVR